jgi:hypothetical protein
MRWLVGGVVLTWISSGSLLQHRVDPNMVSMAADRRAKSCVGSLAPRRRSFSLKQLKQSPVELTSC